MVAALKVGPYSKEERQLTQGVPGGWGGIPMGSTALMARPRGCRFRVEFGPS